MAMRTLKEKKIDLPNYDNFADAQYLTGSFIEHVYITKRIHSSARYLTPQESEYQYHEQHTVVH